MVGILAIKYLQMYGNIISKIIYEHYHYAVPIIDPWLGTWEDLDKLI